jgi:hypothetical protein
LKDEIAIIYIFLISRFLVFLTDAKNKTAIKSAILLIQSIRQGVMPDSIVSNSTLEKSSFKIHVWNTNFRVLGEHNIFTGSKVTFECCIALYDPNTDLCPPVGVDGDDKENNGDRNYKRRGNNHVKIPSMDCALYCSGVYLIMLISI